MGGRSTYCNLHLENKRGQEEQQIGKHVKEGKRVTLEKKKEEEEEEEAKWARERVGIYSVRNERGEVGRYEMGKWVGMKGEKWVGMKGGKWVGMKWV